MSRLLEDDAAIQRYARHIVMPEIGSAGQERLLASRVLVVGAGGLGSPALMYLAAAGIGTIGIVDDDRVELSNLQRQIIHDTPSLGQLKLESAGERLRALNPGVAVVPLCQRLDGGNARSLVSHWDIVVDGTDNFEARQALNDACHAAGRTWIFAAMLRFDGQVSVFKSYQGPPHPCYRCLMPEPPPHESLPSCAMAGVLGSVAGTLGAMQATETVKELLGLGDSLSGRLLLYDALAQSVRPIHLPRHPHCPTCGDSTG